MATATAPKPAVRSNASVETADGLDYRPSYLAAGIAALVVLILYLVTLSPSTAMWDTSEYISAAFTLGLPHPPGNPLFVLIGRVFSILPIAPNVATRINVLAAVCSAGSAAMWFLITERVLVGWLPLRWQRVTGASVATLIGATAFTVWNQSVVNEKVYTVSLFGIAVISWLMIRWSDDPDGRRADRILVLVAYLLGLGYANHMAGMLPAGAVGIAVLVRRPRTLTRWKLLLACIVALGFGITPFAIQPIRAAYFPPINEGEPTACENGLHLSCTFSKETYDRFMYNFNRGQYGKPALTERQAPFIQGQVGMWWYYFKWQWLRDAHLDHQGLQNLLGAIFLVLGLFGGYLHYQKDRRSFWYFGTLMLSMTLILIYYLNFKYGSTQSPGALDALGQPVDREVRDRDYFFLWSFSAWGVWAGLGLLFIWESVSALFGTEREKLGSDVVEEPKPRSWLYGSPVLVLALVPFFGNLSSAPRRGFTDTADFATDLLNSVEPYGVLVVVGDNDTFPLWYAQEVEGIRKDVVVANTSLLNTDWYTRQLIRRPVFDYDAAKGPAIYRNKVWTKPSGPPLNMTPAQADSVPPYMLVNQPMQMNVGSMVINIDPRKLPSDGQGGGILQRADIFVLRMIHDSWPGRPIYFSRTSGGYPRQLGMDNYVITQGLASKVFLPPAQMGPDTVYVPQDGYFDVGRTRELWEHEFKGPQSLIRRGDWIDPPSVGIPYLYVATGIELSEALRDRDPRTAQSVLTQTRDVAKAVRLQQALNIPDITGPGTAPSDSAAGRALPIPIPDTKTKSPATKSSGTKTKGR